jgi:hypothetical protein
VGTAAPWELTFIAARCVAAAAAAAAAIVVSVFGDRGEEEREKVEVSGIDRKRKIVEIVFLSCSRLFSASSTGLSVSLSLAAFASKHACLSEQANRESEKTITQEEKG